MSIAAHFLLFICRLKIFLQKRCNVMLYFAFLHQKVQIQKSVIASGRMLYIQPCTCTEKKFKEKKMRQY